MRIDAVPIWTIFAATIVVVMLAIEAGYGLGQVMHRRSADEKESPVSAIAGTVLGTVLGMMGVGYQTGIAGSKRSMARPILALAFALVFTLIASLDGPHRGIVKVTQQPLIDLRDSMAAAAGHASHE